ncbi:unnamed protein product, partial [marine sediment metagenome]
GIQTSEEVEAAGLPSAETEEPVEILGSYTFNPEEDQP